MAIEYVVDSLDQVGEDIRGAYVEAEGKFNFDADRYAELKATGLKKKNGELLGKVKQAEAELGKYGKFKSLTELLAEADEAEIAEFQERWGKRHELLESKTAKPASEESAKIREQLERAHAKQLQARASEIDALKGELTSTKAQLREINLWTPLRELFIKANGDPGDWEVARLELANQKRFDFDDDGKIVVMADGYPDSVTPEKFFKDVYSEARPKFYKASGAAGSGASNNQTGGHGSKTIKREAFEALGQYDRAQAIKNGLKVVD